MLAALLLLPTASPALFESHDVGVRARALGRNFVSIAADPSALYWNPAGIVRLPSHVAHFEFQHRPDLEGVRQGFVAAVVHLPRVSLGVGWSTARLQDAFSEDIVYLSAAGNLVQRALGAFVAGGINLKLAHVGLETVGLPDIPGLRGGQTRVTADLGVLLSPIPNVTTGVMLRNLGRPRFDLIAGGDQTAWLDELEWGVSLHWRPDARLHFSRVRHPRREPASKIGVELDVASSLQLRLGVNAQGLAGGAAVQWGDWTFESATESDPVLGWTQQFGIQLEFGPRRGRSGGFDEF